MKRIILLLIVCALPLIAAKKGIEKKEIKYQFSAYEMMAFIIKSHESFSPVAYRDGKDADGKKRYSKGWGTKARGKQKTTLKEANEDFKKYIMTRLMNDIENVYHLREREPVVYACLCDLAYNRGSIPKPIQRAALDQNFEKVARLLPRYVRDSHGKKLKGLVKRRNFCKDLILNRHNKPYVNAKIKERKEIIISKITK